MVPANGLTGGVASLFQAATDIDIPKGAKKLTLPPLLKPEMIPVGSVVSGKIQGLVASISPRPDMKDSKLVHLIHENGTEFLLPLTGTIKKALGGFEGAEKATGKVLIVKRQPDGATDKYSGKGEPAKKVYMFDVYLA